MSSSSFNPVRFELDLNVVTYCGGCVGRATYSGRGFRQRAGLQAADRQACRTLWAQVLSSSVTECLSGSCSSLDVMFLWTVCRKPLAPETQQRHLDASEAPQFKSWRNKPVRTSESCFLTVLVSVVGPVRTLIRIVCRNAELQRRNAGQVFIV